MTNNKKVNSGLKIYKINKTKIDKITQEFSVDKDLLLFASNCDCDILLIKIFLG